MKLGLANQTVQTGPKTLVLGPRSSGKRIVEALKYEGFDAIGQWDTTITLPRSFDPNARSKIKEQISPFFNGARGVLHPGTGSWAEKADLLSIGSELQINVLAPSAKNLSLFCNKINLLSEADRIKIPNLVLSFDPIHSLRELEKGVHEVMKGREKNTYPFVLRSALGSFGVGANYKVFFSMDEVQKNLSLWISELRYGVGEALLFFERYLEGGRKIDVPFARFADGTTHFFQFVDSSLQTSRRKIIEISPCPSLSEELDVHLKEISRKFLDHVSFVGVGSLSYLVDGNQFYLVDGMAKLSPSFELIEKSSGENLISWQVGSLTDPSASKKFGVGQNPEKEKESSGYSLSFRIFSENCTNGYPQPGYGFDVKDQELAGLNGYITHEDLSEDIAHHENETEAIGLGIVHHYQYSKLLEETVRFLNSLWYSGTFQTNESYLLEVLNHPWVRSGFFHTGFLDEEFVPDFRIYQEIKVLCVGICEEIDRQLKVQTIQKSGWMVGGEWIESSKGPMHWVESPRVFSIGSFKGLRGKLRNLRFRSPECPVEAFPVSENSWQVRVGPYYQFVRRHFKRDTNSLSFNLSLNSQVSGRVHSILFKEGSRILSREPLLLVESLGELVPHSTFLPVKIVNWKVQPEQEILVGQELATLQRIEKE